MPIWSRLFGSRSDPPPGGSAGEGQGEDYRGFRITPVPVREGGSYRVAARIEKEVAGVPRRHDLVRADTTAALEDATRLSVAKARQLIDERGEGLFDR